jgi:mRNA-degrading endonuclease RelE of RelBE toxin-antitoxin system
MPWSIEFHPELLHDLDRLTRAELAVFAKKKDKIRENPIRQKHLAGGDNCYREPLIKGLRIVYAVHGSTVWLLCVGKHDEAYDGYRQRLQTLRTLLSRDQTREKPKPGL